MMVFNGFPTEGRQAKIHWDNST